MSDEDPPNDGANPVVASTGTATAPAHGPPVSAVTRKICAIHQPHYLPWGRYLHKIAAADVFVVLDDAQYNKNGWQNRNRIKGPQGPFNLTVPVRRRFPIRLIEAEIADARWPRAHLSAIRTSYGRSPGFEMFYPALESLLRREWTLLHELNGALLEVLIDLLAIPTKILRSSQLDRRESGTARLAAICTQLGATHYLTGEYAVDAYLEPQVLRAAGIDLLYQLWTPPVYPQAHPRRGFAPDLSVIDLIASAGADSLSLIQSAGRVSCEPSS